MASEVEIQEAEAMLATVTDYLLLSVSPTAEASKGAALRRAVGVLLAKPWDLVKTDEFAASMLACFTTAYKAGIKFYMLRKLVAVLLEQQPTFAMATAIQLASLVYSLSTQARLIVDTDFKSRDDVDAVMAAVKANYNAVRDLAADRMDNVSYMAVNKLGASVVHYLVETARPLPRMVDFSIAPMPSLTWANRIYADGSRAEELAAENKIVHPAFMPADIRALST